MNCSCNEADKLAPGICLNCHATGDAMAWALIAFAAIYVLGQMIRSWTFFVTLAGGL